MGTCGDVISEFIPAEETGMEKFIRKSMIFSCENLHLCVDTLENLEAINPPYPGEPD
jgi:hypothetical protein